MTTTITLMGAGGKMGCRIADNLRKTEYSVRHVEVGDRGKAALAQRGITPLPAEQALDGTDVVILALPDNRIGRVTSEQTIFCRARTPPKKSRCASASVSPPKTDG